MLIDESAFTEAACYRLTQTHHLDGHTIRVRVHRDFYPHQSWAAAEVLTPALTWTELATAPASDWHPTTRTVRTAATDGLDCLRPIADHLTQRAQQLLSTITHPTTPAAASATPAAPAPSPTPLPGFSATTPPQHQTRPRAQVADDPGRWQPPV